MRLRGCERAVDQRPSSRGKIIVSNTAALHLNFMRAFNRDCTVSFVTRVGHIEPHKHVVFSFCILFFSVRSLPFPISTPRTHGHIPASVIPRMWCVATVDGSAERPKFVSMTYEMLASAAAPSANALYLQPVCVQTETSGNVCLMRVLLIKTQSDAWLDT